jgi:NADPH:quinone reductase-like Zn-dependent oxidoreductase
MADRAQNAYIPGTMQAVRLQSAGGPAGLVAEMLQTPRPGPGEMLVRVCAAAITRDELDWPVNRLPAIPAYEFSGQVAEVGPDAHAYGIGEAVYALGPFDRDGAAAEFTVIPEKYLARKPKRLDHIDSAALPLAALSAWQGLFEHGGLAAGQHVLIHGAAGGVGHYAVQLAKWRGARVTGTVSSRNLDVARKQGLDQVIEHPVTRFEDVAQEVDLVFDTAGGDRLARSPAVIRPGGRLVSVAAEPSQAAAAQRGIQAIFFVVEPNAGQLAEIAALVDAGRLQPVVDSVFPLAQARQAFDRSQKQLASGKIVLRVAEA